MTTFILPGCLLSGSMAAMAWFRSEWSLAFSFTVFFILWSFANALQPVLWRDEAIISFIAFNCLGLSVERVFQAMAILQGSLTVLVIALALGVRRVSLPRSYQEMARVDAAVPVTAVGFDPQTPPTEAEQVS
eukprot:s2676_g14.t1